MQPDPEVNNGLYRSLYKVIISMILNIIYMILKSIQGDASIYTELYSNLLGSDIEVYTG